MNWQYISGFFDADGSITLSTHNKNTNKTLQISFHNNEKNILEDIQSFILENINVKGSISIKKSKNINHSDSYELKYVYLSAYKVSRKIKSIHKKKSHRIKIYHKIQSKTKRNGKYSEEEKNIRFKLVKDFFDN